MSQHSFRGLTPEQQNVEVRMGYDRSLNYVFCVVMKDGDETLYSNLSDRNAGTRQQDVEYYRKILLDLGIRVPESLFEEVKQDQKNRIGNRYMEHK
jgi:hypothetical protein